MRIFKSLVAWAAVALGYARALLMPAPEYEERRYLVYRAPRSLPAPWAGQHSTQLAGHCVAQTQSPAMPRWAFGRRTSWP